MKTVDCRFRVFHPEFGLRDSFSTFREARLRALAQIDAKELQIEDVMAHVGQTYLWRDVEVDAAGNFLRLLPAGC
jgi:hypothetical protein